MLADRFSPFGVIGNGFCDNIAGAVKGVIGSFNTKLGVDIFSGVLLERLVISIFLSVKKFGKRLETFFASNVCTGLSMGREGTVNVFDLRQNSSVVKGFAQFFGELALFGNMVANLLASFFKVAEILKSVIELSENGVVKRTGNLFSVSRDEGNCVALVDKIYRCVNSFQRNIKFFC